MHSRSLGHEPAREHNTRPHSKTLIVIHSFNVAIETELRIKSQMIFKHEHWIWGSENENELTRERRVKRKVAEEGDIPDAALIWSGEQSWRRNLWRSRDRESWFGLRDSESKTVKGVFCSLRIRFPMLEPPWETVLQASRCQ